MEEKSGEQFLIIFRLGDPSLERVQEFVPKIQGVLTRISTEPIQIIARSMNADVFAYAIRCELVAAQIRARIESPGDMSRFVTGREQLIEPPLSGNDNLIVLQVGPDFAASQGFSRELAWFQHH